MSKKLPSCGLYRTTQAHPDRPTQVPVGQLVHFHNHSDAGHPIILLPKANVSNTWNFESKGFLVKDASWCSSLVGLLPEGFYRLGEALRMPDGRVVPNGQVVQVGYNRAGEPIAFFGTWSKDSNTLTFSTKGSKLSERAIAGLTPLAHGGPAMPTATGGHP